LPYDDQGESDIVENVRAAKVRDGTSVFFASEYALADLWNSIREARNFSSPMCEQIEKVCVVKKNWFACLKNTGWIFEQARFDGSKLEGALVCSSWANAVVLQVAKELHSKRNHFAGIHLHGGVDARQED
jgi:hypothetical protein